MADLSGQTGARRQAGRFVGEADRRRDGGCHRCLGCFAFGYRLGQAHHNHGRSCTTRTRRFGICSTGTRGADDVIGCAGRDAECDVDRGAVDFGPVECTARRDHGDDNIDDNDDTSCSRLEVSVRQKRCHRLRSAISCGSQPVFVYGLRTTTVGAYRGREVSGSRIVGFTVHELSIAQSVVEAVCERAGERRVSSVRLEVGQLCAVVPHSLLFCFDVVTAGTHAEGASLHIDEIATSARCKSCGVMFSPPDMFLLCECGSADVEVLAGRELRILSMEVS